VTTHPASHSRRLLAARKFFRTPKGPLTLVFGILLALAVPAAGAGQVTPGLLAATGIAALVDLVILRARNGAWEFPSGAILTGLIIAMLLTPLEPWYVGAVTSALAVVSKYVLRSRAANLFNPAALGIVATFYIFDTGQNWWGSLPDSGVVGLVALFATGAFITDRVNKMPMVLAFLGAYYLLFTGTAFAGQAERVSEIFRSPDLQAVLFFAFFILTDPPTSPTKYPHQVFCGVLVAVASYLAFEVIGASYYLLAGVLIGNVWEAWRRWRVTRARRTRASRYAPAPVPLP